MTQLSETLPPKGGRARPGGGYAYVCACKTNKNERASERANGRAGSGRLADEGASAVRLHKQGIRRSFPPFSTKSLFLRSVHQACEYVHDAVVPLRVRARRGGHRRASGFRTPAMKNSASYDVMQYSVLEPGRGRRQARVRGSFGRCAPGQGGREGGRVW